MKKAQKWILGFMVLGILIYLLSPGLPHLINNPAGWNLQAQYMYLTGICTMSLMILTMLVSLRIPKLNSILEGLDKAYNIHKWTGIFTTVFVVIHWLGDKIPLVLLQLNIVPDAIIDVNLYTRPEIIFYKSGTLLAEIFFYVFIFLIVVSLSNKISYKFFRKSHKFVPYVFLVYAYHGATAPLKDHWYKNPSIYVVLLLIGVGSIIALMAVFQQIGKSRKVKTIIQSIEPHESGILDIRLATTGKPFNHTAGQYAFLTFAHSKEPHPFTISSSGDHPGTMRFSIKQLGDFTQELKSKISIGQHVQVEGPYGEFKFEDNLERQIWIAGGIGITPFMAQLDFLLNNGGAKKPVDLWYCTKGELKSQFPMALTVLCDKVGVNLYHLNSDKGEFFSTDILKDKFKKLDKCSIWFCGPPILNSIINKGLKSMDYNMTNFHYDSFSMR